jgi:hypothetical protein
MSLGINLSYTANHSFHGSHSPLLWQQATTILPTRPQEGTGRNIIMIRPAHPRHDGVTEHVACDGGVIAVPYLSTSRQPLTDGA